ncbi:NADP-dependent oxidoreductase domain-containing protein [Coniochaeta sp. 2T2.1]|nr:NADP-dependent oxidoreductase domain-containing protein [Coniochaeta sp. 2T2.1]
MGLNSPLARSPNILFGAGGIGTGKFTYTWDTPEKVSSLLTSLSSLGITELDSAASYPPASEDTFNAETLLGKAGAVEKGFVIDSQVLHKGPTPFLSAGKIAASIDKTLEVLGTTKIRTLYAHANDELVKIEEQARGFNEQWRMGKFERLGICNYSAKNMEKYFAVCEEKGYVKPAVYQGCYNAITRGPEDKLIPLLRRHNCAFYAYSPLAGGFLTGKVTLAKDSPSTSSHFLDRTRWAAGVHPGSAAFYDHPEMHSADRSLRKVCEAQSPALTVQKACLRWIMYHSVLGDGDAIIVVRRGLISWR